MNVALGRTPAVATSRSTAGLPAIPAAGIPAVTRELMREVDRLMIEEYGIQLLQMMENAGLSLAQLAQLYLGGSLRGQRVTVLAGRGNNGGGGLTAARRLSAWGARVEVVLMSPVEDYRDAPAAQLGILQQMSVSVQPFAGALPDHDLLVDAIIGYSLNGPPQGTARELIAAANGTSTPIISLDTPSGLDVDSGEAPGKAVRAAATLTLALPKVGLLQSKARPYVGQLYVSDISVPPELYARLGLSVPPLFAEGPMVSIVTKQDAALQ